MLTSKSFNPFFHKSDTTTTKNNLVLRCLSQRIPKPRINSRTWYTRLHVSNFSFSVIQHARPGSARRIPLCHGRPVNRGINRILPPLNHLLNRHQIDIIEISEIIQKPVIILTLLNYCLFCIGGTYNWVAEKLSSRIWNQAELIRKDMGARLPL